MNFEYIGNPNYGIRVYKNLLTNQKEIIDVIENSITLGNSKDLSWQPAMVGFNKIVPSYRNCWDCKLSSKTIEMSDGIDYEFKQLFYNVVRSIGICVDDYAKKYKLNLDYMEAVNFVKYSAGEYFGGHSDHGHSYVCTVSSVAYLNDEYEGGELYFEHLDEKIKPEFGDIVVFPSTFIYKHAALPVLSGIKYSAVTMFDYNDSCHKAGGYA